MLTAVHVTWQAIKVAKTWDVHETHIVVGLEVSLLQQLSTRSSACQQGQTVLKARGVEQAWHFFFLETWPWQQSQGRIYSSLTLSLTSAKELLYLHSPPCYLEQVWIFRWFLFLLFSFRPSFISILFMDTWDISPDGSLSLSFLFSRYLLLKHTLWKASSSSREQPFYSSSHCNIWFGTTEFTPSC